MSPRCTIPNEWTPTRVAELGRLWFLGFSAKEVAAALKERAFAPSRNAVIGKIHRLGWAQREVSRSKFINHDRPGATTRPIKRHNPRPVKPSKPLPASVLLTTEFARPWTERLSGECTWPIGEGESLLSCCAPVADPESLSSWCAAHNRIGRVPVKPLKRPYEPNVLRRAA